MAEVDPQLQDHVVGLELEMVELARKADQAALEGWPDEEARLRKELDTLYAELASVAERLTAEPTVASPAVAVDAERPQADPDGGHVRPGNDVAPQLL